jgi:hypothetical protein
MTAYATWNGRRVSERNSHCRLISVKRGSYGGLPFSMEMESVVMERGGR